MASLMALLDLLRGCSNKTDTVMIAIMLHMAQGF